MFYRLIAFLILTNGFSLFGQPDQRLSESYIIDRYVEAMGGRSNLHNIKSVRLSCTVSYPDGSNNRIVVLKRKPDRVRISIDLGRKKIVQSYNGELAWISVQDANGFYHAEMKGDERQTFIREAALENALINPRPAGAVLSRDEDEELNGILYYQLKATFPKGGYTIFSIDRNDFTERRIKEFDAQGNLLAELIPGRFEKHAGVLFAMQVIRLKDGERVSTLKINRVDVNIGILDKAFDPPLSAKFNEAADIVNP